MTDRTNSPLGKIQQDLLDGTVSTTRMLQNCIVLAGIVGSTDLRAWARKELDGYQPGEELPSYRKIHAQLYIDGQNGLNLFKGVGIGPDDLPAVVREAGIGNEIHLRQGLPELEAIADGEGSAQHLSLPQGDTIKKMMNTEMADEFAQIHRVYYSVQRTTFRGVVEAVRTALADLVSELLRMLPPDQQMPTKEQADQAVNFTVTGDSANVTFTNSQASGAGTSTARAGEPTDDRSWWQRWKKRGIVVGLFTIAGAGVTVATWVGYTPWS